MTNGIFYFASVHYLYSKFRVACDVTFLNIAKYFNIRKIKFGIFFIFKKKRKRNVYVRSGNFIFFRIS